MLSQFARDADEYWAMLTDMAGPIAPLLSALTSAERKQVAGDVANQIGQFRSGDVLRIPAQAQLAWGRA